jgi:outer membrane protein OmpA-like peptidoglycan-associated protein
MRRRRRTLLTAVASLTIAGFLGLSYRVGLLFPPRPLASGTSEIARHPRAEVARESAAPRGRAVEAPDQGGPPATSRAGQTSSTATEQTFTVYFYPNDSNPLRQVARQRKGQIALVPYDAQAATTLKRVAQAVARIEPRQLIIRGYCDQTIDEAPFTAGRRLARERALAVRHLVQHLSESHGGLEATQIVIESHGAPRNDAQRAPASNRRVELEIVDSVAGAKSSGRGE